MHKYLKISGLVLDFDTRFPQFVAERCAKYLIEPQEIDPGERILPLSVSEEQITLADVENVGRQEAELYALNIPLCEQLPLLGRLMTHGVAVECDGKAFIFTAESGTGKSTHAFLWQRYLGEDRVHVINGDKPILWFRQDGEILACGSPWSGKERLDLNECVPLRGICLLERLENKPEGGPRIAKASGKETFDFLLHQTYLPQNPEAQMQTFQLLETLYGRVPVYNLITDMSREGVKVSVDCLLEQGS